MLRAALQQTPCSNRSSHRSTIRALECFQLFAVFALVRNETCLGVNVLGQIKGVALVVFNGANKVNGVKVRTLLKHGLLFGVIHVNLRTFKYLQRNGAIGIVGQERTTARFAHVAYHATHTHGAVELLRR